MIRQNDIVKHIGTDLLLKFVGHLEKNPSLGFFSYLEGQGVKSMALVILSLSQVQKAPQEDVAKWIAKRIQR